MKKQLFTQFWQRRICELIFTIAAGVLGVYAWVQFGPAHYAPNVTQMLTEHTAMVAGGSMILSILCYLWMPRRHRRIVPVLMFSCLVALALVATFETGGLRSPLLSLWFFVQFFAGLFSLRAIIILAMVNSVFLLQETYLNEGPLPMSMLILIGFTSVAVLFMSYITWIQRPAHATDNEMAHRLSIEEGKSDAVLEAISNGVIAIDEHEKIELINLAAQQIVGWNKGDALGIDYTLILQLIDSKNEPIPREQNPITQAKQTGKAFQSRNIMLATSSDKLLMISLSVTPVNNGKNTIIVFRDITKEAKEEREQAEFISTASHEMRTPVAIIEGYLSLALNPTMSTIDKRARGYITKAHDSANHLGQLLQDLLDITRIDDGRMKSDPRPTDINMILQDIWNGLQVSAKEKGLEFHLNTVPEKEGLTLSPIYFANVDPGHLREVLSNLLENAIKYTNEGEVSVTLSGNNDTITVAVADSGIGVPAEDVPHLFQKFYRVDNSGTREIGGTGLGLYLSRRLSEAMNGKLWVESEYHKGSTFYLRLPRMTYAEIQQYNRKAAETETDQAPVPLAHAVEPTGELPDKNATYTPAEIVEQDELTEAARQVAEQWQEETSEPGKTASEVTPAANETPAEEQDEELDELIEQVTPANPEKQPTPEPTTKRAHRRAHRHKTKQKVDKITATLTDKQEPLSSSELDTLDYLYAALEEQDQHTASEPGAAEPLADNVTDQPTEAAPAKQALAQTGKAIDIVGGHAKKSLSPKPKPKKSSTNTSSALLETAKPQPLPRVLTSADDEVTRMIHQRSESPKPAKDKKLAAPTQAAAPAVKIATGQPKPTASPTNPPKPKPKPEPEPIIGRRFGAQPLKTVYQNMISPETAAARRIHQMNLAATNRPKDSTAMPARENTPHNRALHISITEPERPLVAPGSRPHQIHPFLGHRSTTLLNPAAALHRYQRDRLSQPKAPDVPEDSEKTP